jgi:hypothetical protein
MFMAGEREKSIQPEATATDKKEARRAHNRGCDYRGELVYS